MRYLKKELLLIIIGLSFALSLWLFVYTPATEKIEAIRAELVILERETDALYSATLRAPVLEKEFIALSRRLEHLKVKERLTRRSPLYIMGVFSKFASETEVEISPIKMVEANPGWQGFEMTVQANSFSSFGNYIERLFNSHLLLKVRSAITEPHPDGAGLRIALVIDGWTGK
jgi:hypothetical protein